MEFRATYRIILACCALPILASCDFSSTLCDLEDLKYQCTRPHESDKQMSRDIEVEQKEILTQEGRKTVITTMPDLVGGIARVKESPDGSIFLAGGQGSMIVRKNRPPMTGTRPT